MQRKSLVECGAIYAVARRPDPEAPRPQQHGFLMKARPNEGLRWPNKGVGRSNKGAGRPNEGPKLLPLPLAKCLGVRPVPPLLCQLRVRVRRPPALRDKVPPLLQEQVDVPKAQRQPPKLPNDPLRKRDLLAQPVEPHPPRVKVWGVHVQGEKPVWEEPRHARPLAPPQEPLQHVLPPTHLDQGRVKKLLKKVLKRQVGLPAVAL